MDWARTGGFHDRGDWRLPASGKTSLARMLAQAHPQGVHVEADAFFRFMMQRQDPSLPVADHQNKVAMRACVAACVEYAAGACQVYLDGVVGPWLLPMITAIIPDIEYVLLHAPLDVVPARNNARTSQPSATPGVVSRMHADFEQVVGSFSRHVIGTEGKTTEQVANEYEAGSRAGTFLLGGAQASRSR